MVFLSRVLIVVGDSVVGVIDCISVIMFVMCGVVIEVLL